MNWMLKCRNSAADSKVYSSLQTDDKPVNNHAERQDRWTDTSREDGCAICLWIGCWVDMQRLYESVVATSDVEILQPFKDTMHQFIQSADKSILEQVEGLNDCQKR